nr:hypothetical protein [Deltaproteobacteria bacterium]
ELHFIASESTYNHAQSGSDWATHVVVVGQARVDGDRLGAITLVTEVDANITESSWEWYRPSRVVEGVRDKVLARLGVQPPPPQMVTATTARCPACGATTVAEQLCNVCGHTGPGVWSASYERRVDDDTPDFVKPAPSTEAGFELRGEPGADARILIHHGIGYAIVLPDPWPRGPAGAQCAIVECDRYYQIVARAETFEGDAAAALERAAKRRAKHVDPLELAPTPPGGTWCGFVMYDRDIDWKPHREMLALVVKQTAAVFLYACYPTRSIDSPKWLRFRDALFANQTWQPDELVTAR